VIRIKKLLIFGIIALFIGVGIQPAISNEIQIKKTSDINDDCIECQSNGKTHLAEKLLNRLENYLEAKDLINAKNPVFERPICELLLEYGRYYADLWEHYRDLALQYPFKDYYHLMCFIYMTAAVQMFTIGLFLRCWELPEN